MRGLLVGLVASALAGCGATDGAATRGGQVTVFAAASLTDAFGDIAAAFETANPGLTVAFNFAGSQQLAGQIVEGAPADVFASASPAQTDVVVAAGLAAHEPVDFAGNRLEIAVEPGNPLLITGLADLDRDDIVLVLAAPEVPAGHYAAEALTAAGVEVHPASLDNDVRAALAKVELGEADAAVVYRSDIDAAGEGVEGVTIPEDQNVVATYPVTVLTAARNADAAEAFVAFVMSAAGQQILRDHGFAGP